MDGLLDHIGKTEPAPFKRELFRPIMERYFDSPERLVHCFVEIKDAISKKPEMPLSKKAFYNILIKLQTSALDEIIERIKANPDLSEKEACLEIGLDLIEVFMTEMLDPSEMAIKQAKEELMGQKMMLIADSELEKLAKEKQRKLIVEYLLAQFNGYLGSHAPPVSHSSTVTHSSLADLFKWYKNPPKIEDQTTEGKIHLKIKFVDVTAFITKEDEQTFLVKYAFTGVFIPKKLSKQQLVDDLLDICRRKDYPIVMVMSNTITVKGTPMVESRELSRFTVGGEENLFKKELLYHLVFL